MNDLRKTKAQLVEEIKGLRQRVAALEEAGQEALGGGELAAVYEDVSEHQRAEQRIEESLAEVQRREREVSGLLKASRAVLSKAFFEKTARAIFDICRDLTGADSGYVALLTPDGDENAVLFLESGGRPCSVDPDLPMPIRGLRAEAYRTGKAVFENRFLTSEWMSLMPGGHVALDNVMFAPLNTGDTTVGLIGLANSPRGFSEADAALATSFGELAAIALQKTRSEEALDWELRLHSALAELSTAILSEELGIEDVTQLVLARARELTRSEHGYVATVDPKTGIMVAHTLTRMMDRWPVPEADKRISFPPGADGRYPSLWGHSLNTGKPFYTNAPQAHEAARGAPEGHLPLKNFLSVPTVFGERLLGQITLANCEGGFDDRDLEAIERLSALYAALLRRREIEGELHRAKALLSAAIEQTPAGIVIADAPDVHMQIINSAALGIHNSTRSELTDIPWELAPERWQTFHPDGTPFTADELPLARAVRDGETIENVEIIVRRPDGEKRWVLANAAPVRNERGEIIAGVVVFPDITERKREEEELKRLAATVEQSPEAVVMTNRCGDVEYINPAFERFSGFSRQEAIGKKPYELLCSDRYGKDFYEETWNALRTRRTWQERITVEIRDGAQRVIDMIISPVLNGTGAIVNFLHMARDVTREVELENQLLQGQKLEAIGTLAGGIAHDFNNILCVMLGNTELVSQDLGADDPAQELLREALIAGHRASDLVAQILTFSRRKEAHRELLNPHLIIKEGLRFLRSSIPQTVTIEQNISTQCGYVFVDPTQLHQVIVNLCTNAYQALGAAGGTLRVELGPIRIEQEAWEHAPELAPGDYVRLTVSDTGCGMDAGTRQRVFEPFFTTKHKGTGLGLSTVHGIVSALGGTIRITSAPGQGSTFSVYLPQTPDKPAEEEGEERIRTLPTGSGERIVVVDDEPSILKLVERNLWDLGYSPLAFSSPMSALAAIERDPSAFDVVLTDQIMPGMTGGELAARVLTVRPDMTVLLMTGYSVTLTEEQAGAIGIRRCVMKPLRKRELAEALHEALAL